MGPVDPLPVRARTVLAAARRVEVRLPALDGAVHAPLAVAADDDGDVYLVDPQPQEWTRRDVLVRWRARDPHLGELVLVGRTWGALAVEDVPELAAALVPGMGCARGGACGRCPARPLDVRALRVVPVVAQRLRLERVLGPGAGSSQGVPLALFRGARPDAWAVERATVAEHLERDHQDALRRLVAHLSGPVGTSAVSVRSLDDDGLVLSCLTGDGVTDVVLPFDRPVRDAQSLGAWLRRHAPGG